MAEQVKRIACIGWGSLVWDPRALPVVGDWMIDGPSLPIEFARESRDGRLTLVLCEGATLVPSCWALLNVEDVGFAIEALAAREEITSRIAHDIGWWSVVDGKARGACSDAIKAWAQEHQLDDVVWTNLPCGFKSERGSMPSEDEVLAYLAALDESRLNLALEYVRKAPAQVRTRYRQAIERAFDLAGNGSSV